MTTIGYSDQMNEEEQVQLKILNIQGIYSVVAGLIFFIKSFFQANEDVWFVLMMTTLFSIVLILNYLKKLSYTKTYWTVLLPIMIFGLIITYGNEPHGELLLIIPVVNIFILFHNRLTRTLLTFFVVFLSAIALTHNNLYESPMANSTDSTDSLANFLITILCIGTIISIYTKALRKQLQISTTTVRALEDANADLEHFTYMASHNLKTPLRTIMGNIFLMQRMIPKTTSNAVQKYTQEIKTSANDMHVLINDIMEYAVFIQNEMTNIETIDIAELTDNITKSVNLSLGKTGVCTFHGQEKISTNRTLIKSILQNLIENGFKYNDSEIPTINIEAIKEQNAFLIKVTDNGIGINAEYFDKVFVMFKRLHHNSEYEGTGIGLAMCKRLLNKYNGKIWLASEVGKGSTFFVRIPFNLPK